MPNPAIFTINKYLTIFTTVYLLSISKGVGYREFLRIVCSFWKFGSGAGQEGSGSTKTVQIKVLVTAYDTY